MFVWQIMGGIEEVIATPLSRLLGGSQALYVRILQFSEQDSIGLRP